MALRPAPSASLSMEDEKPSIATVLRADQREFAEGCPNGSAASVPALDVNVPLLSQSLDSFPHLPESADGDRPADIDG